MSERGKTLKHLVVTADVQKPFIKAAVLIGLVGDYSQKKPF